MHSEFEASTAELASVAAQRRSVGESLHGGAFDSMLEAASVLKGLRSGAVLEMLGRAGKSRTTRLRNTIDAHATKVEQAVKGYTAADDEAASKLRSAAKPMLDGR